MSRRKVGKPKKVIRVALLREAMVNDFQDKDYEIAEGVYTKPGLPVPHTNSIIPAVKELSDIARKYDIFIADTLDKHKKDDPEFKKWPPHCIKHFSGSNVINELVVEGARTYGKQKYGGFTNPYLARDLKNAGVDTVMIVGVVGNVCVKATGKGAVKNGFKVIFVKEAICFLPDVENNLKLKMREIKKLEKVGRVVSLEEAIKILEG